MSVKNKDAKKDKTESPKSVRVVKVLAFFIPLGIVAYLFAVNFFISHEFNYFYDIGSEKDLENPYLNPLERVSDVDEDGSYRELKHNLVYFDVPIVRGAEEISVSAKFKDNFPENYRFIIGGKDEEVWSYEWKTLYDPILEELGEFYIGQGVYRINKKLSDNPENIDYYSGLIIGSNVDMKREINIIEDYRNQDTVIDVVLRGDHRFYVYAKDTLKLSVKKQDINWYDGSDELDISIYDMDGNLIGNLTIEDDGIIDDSKSEGNILDGSLGIMGLEEGVYLIEFGNFDGLINEIKINSNKIVAAERVYLGNSNLFFDDLGGESRVYTKSTKSSQVSFKTWHDGAFQEINVNDVSFYLDSRVEPTVFQLSMNEFYEVVSAESDVIVETPGYFSFSKESYFEPFKNRVVGIGDSKFWISNNLDYIVIEEYNAPKEDGDWLVSDTLFNIEEDGLYVKDNKLSLVFNTPHLSGEQFLNNTIAVDWINITVYKPGVFR